MTLMYTYHGTRLLRRRAEHLCLERPRAELRQLRQTLRARRLRELLRVMAIETVTTEELVTWTAQLAAATSTRNESKQCCWLEIVSACVKIEEHGMATYLCHLCHPSDPQNIRTDSLHGTVDAEESKSHLQKSAKAIKSN